MKRRYSWFVLLALVWTASAVAQTAGTGAIAGTVSDASRCRDSERYR